MKKWRNKRQDKNKKNKAKFAGHRQIPILFASKQFIIVMIFISSSHQLSQVSQVLLLQKQNKQKKKKKEKKILLLSQFTNKLSIVCPVP